MEKKNNEIAKNPVTDSGEKKITRKEAIKKTGYIAASAATMMVLLSNPAKANRGCDTSPTDPGKQHDGGRHRGGHHDGGHKKSTGSGFAGDSW